MKIGVQLLERFTGLENWIPIFIGMTSNFT